MKKLKNYFPILTTLVSCKRNVNKLPKCTGPHLLRNVITLAAKQQNHRINKEHLTFQIKMLREAIFSSYTFIY